MLTCRESVYLSRFLRPGTWALSSLDPARCKEDTLRASHFPELVDLKLFGKTMFVVNKKFGLFSASQLGK